MTQEDHTRVVDLGVDSRGHIEPSEVPMPRRLAVLDFLAGLNPIDVYGISEVAVDGHVATFVYYLQR